jgi:hypothetical protein
MRAWRPIPIIPIVMRLDGAFFPKTVDGTIVGKVEITPAALRAPRACRRVQVALLSDLFFILG